MRRSNKFIIVALLAAVVLVGGTAGIVFARTGNADDSQPEARSGALLDRVCEIYQEQTGESIDQEVLKGAFAQARSEIQSEQPDGRWFGAPMTRHAGILENLGIEIDQETLKAAMSDARERIQAGEDRQEVMAEVLESLGVDLAELKAACAEDQSGEQPFKHFGFRSQGGPRGWGRLHPAE